MLRPQMTPPPTDPTPIFEHFRGNHATELLACAVVEFNLFDSLADRPQSFSELEISLGLAERPVVVLTTALRAMGLLDRDQHGRIALTPMARTHLTSGSDFDVSGYFGLAGQSTGVREMADRLRSNRPAGSKPDEQGAAFIFREGLDSAMEREASARELTLALAGRARSVAPVLARSFPLGEARVLLDVAGGTGLYAIAYLQSNPNLRAIVWDRPEVLKVAVEMAGTHGVADRLECRAGDMFVDRVPANADVILLSNVLHDWDVPECRALLARLTSSLPRSGRILIHDVFLNDALDGPLPIALYSAALFALTEGRAYSAREYRGWLEELGLTVGSVVPTLIHCGVLPAFKS